MDTVQTYILMVEKERDDLKASNARLLAALTETADAALRASLVQDRSVHIIKQTCRYIADEANTALAEAKP